jgi:hypothetical protein
MYDRFSDKGAHSTEWFKIAKNFLKLAFAGDHREARCPCNRCRNRMMLSEYEMSDHIAKHRFMPNYLVLGLQVHIISPIRSETIPCFICT